MSRRTHVATILALCVLTFAVYSNSFSTALVQDAPFLVVEDPRVHSLGLETVRAILTKDYWGDFAVSGLYRPVTTFTYAVNNALAGEIGGPFGFHVFNFVVHATNVAFAYLLSFRVFGAALPAALAAAVFAAHPANTEAVTNVAGRADLLSALFVLAGLLLYAAASQSPGLRRAFFLSGLAITALLGVLSKENAVVLPAFILIHWATFARDGRLRSILSARAVATAAAVVLPFAIVLWIRALVFATLRAPDLPYWDNPLVDADGVTTAATAIKVLGLSLWTFLWPRVLSSDYSYDQIPLVRWPIGPLRDWEFVSSAAALVALGCWAIRSHQSDRRVFFFVGFAFAALLPTSNLLLPIGTIRADRFLYLPSIGLAGALVVSVQRLVDALIARASAPSGRREYLSRVVFTGALAAVILAYGVRAYVRNLDWSTEEALWGAASASSPRSFKVHRVLAHQHFAQSPYPDLGRAIAEAETAVSIVPDHPQVWEELGLYYVANGDAVHAGRAHGGAPGEWWEKGVAALQRAAALDRRANEEYRAAELRRNRSEEDIPHRANVGVYVKLADALERLGRHREALEPLRYLRAVVPTEVELYDRIGDTALRARDLEVGAVAYHQALAVGRDPAERSASLAAVYRELDPNGCSTVSRGKDAVVNVDCPFVRERYCAAVMELADIWIHSGNRRLTQELLAGALRRCG